MSTERRAEARWKVSRNRHEVEVRLASGNVVPAVLVDLSHRGIGLRADRRYFKHSMPVKIRLGLVGEHFDVPCAVRFVDDYYPRVGVEVMTPHLMERAVEIATQNDFLKVELCNDTLVAHGALTYAVLKEFEAGVRRGARRMDLSQVSDLSLAGIASIRKVAKEGVKIRCCSEAIAPSLDRLKVCASGLCDPGKPCAWDGPKRKPE